MMGMYGSLFHRPERRFDRGFLRVGPAVPEIIEMNAIYWIGAIVSIMLFVYLLVALLKPESFE